MNKPWTRIFFLLPAIAFFLLLSLTPASAEPVALPTISMGLEGSNNPQDVSVSLQVLFLLTILSLAPAILILTTSFTRIVVVLSFMRSALSTQQMPPNQLLVGLALFLTFFIMMPTWSQVNQDALQPYLNGKITQEEAFRKAQEPIRVFMFKQTREKDLALFVKLAQIERPKTYRDIPTYVLIPAFAISELKTAFQIGFMIFIPFIVIDMIVASALMSMGMMMLPPMMISLPFKLLLFVMVDGWHLIVRSLVMSFQ
ncbi:MAG: flagellar type III secretion system pore protein FliP [Clostridia bacterium]|nr:flagellar type III secretion system pore protein FliP [Clostridia bacterium]